MTNPTLVAKYKIAGMTNSVIASKLSISEEEVEQIWKSILETTKKVSEQTGIEALVREVNVLLLQYEVMGQQLQAIAQCFNSQLSEEQLRAQIDKDPEVTLKNLMRLGAFFKAPTAEAIEKTIAEVTSRIVRGN